MVPMIQDASQPRTCHLQLQEHLSQIATRDQLILGVRSQLRRQP